MKVYQLKWQTEGKQLLKEGAVFLISESSCWVQDPMGCCRTSFCCISPVLMANTSPGENASNTGPGRTGTHLLNLSYHIHELKYWTVDVRDLVLAKPLGRYLNYSRKCFKILSHLIITVNSLNSNPVYLPYCGNNQILLSWNHPNSC